MGSEGATQSSSLLQSARNSTRKAPHLVNMESAQLRRPRLEALTATIRLPPLDFDARTEVRPPSKLYQCPLRHSWTGNGRYLRRRRAINKVLGRDFFGDHSSSRTLPWDTKLSALRLAPIIKPYNNPLPEIGLRKHPAKDGTIPSKDETNPSKEGAIQSKDGTIPPKEKVDSKPVSANGSSMQSDLPTFTKELENPDIVKLARLDRNGESSDSGKESSRDVDYKDIVSRMSSEDLDLEKQLQATKEARKVLASGIDCSYPNFTDAGILNPAVRCLQTDNTTLQHEAAWIITNIAAGSSKESTAVVDSGAIKPLVDLLSSPNQQLREQCLWALTNIIGESNSHVKCVIDAGLFKKLEVLLREQNQVSFLRIYAWILSNLTRHKPMHLKQEEMVFTLKAIKTLIENTDEEVQNDCLTTLSAISDVSDYHIQMVLDSDVVPRVVELMEVDSPRVKDTALKVVGYIATGTVEQTQKVLETGVLPITKKMFESNNSVSRKEVAWFWSNVLAGTQDHIQMVIDAGILPVIAKAAKEDRTEVREEAIWALANFTVECQECQISHLVDAGGIQGLLSVLNHRAGSVMVKISMDGLSNIVKKYRDTSELSRLKGIIQSHGGVESMKRLQGSGVEEVSHIAKEILNTCFPDGDDVIEPGEFTSDKHIEKG